jgi:hypothetical protein
MGRLRAGRDQLRRERFTFGLRAWRRLSPGTPEESDDSTEYDGNGGLSGGLIL